MESINRAARKLYNRISQQEKIAFLVCFLGGILSHAMGIFVKFSIHDDPVAFFGTGLSTPLGRWMLDAFYQFDLLVLNDFPNSIPATNGILSLLFISLTACLIVRTLKLRSNVLCGIIGLSMAVFPSVVSLFGYMFTAHYYMLGLFLGVLGASLVCTYGNLTSAAAAAVLLILSMGIYQAYVPFVISFYLLYMLRIILVEPENSVSFILRRAFLILGSVMVSAVGYIVVTNLICQYSGDALSAYKGMDSFGVSSLSDYLARLKSCYARFLKPRFGAAYNPFSIGTLKLYRWTVALIGLLGGWAFFRLLPKSPIKALFLAVLGLLTPVAIHFIFIMTGEDSVSVLMVYAWVFAYILLCFFLDCAAFPNRRLDTAVKGIGLAVLLLTCLLNIRLTNQCYTKMSLLHQEIISYYNVLIARIQSTPGYSDEFPVAFIGADFEEVTDLYELDKTLVDIGELDNIQITPYYGVNQMARTYSMREFMHLWNGYTPEYAEEADVAGLPEIQTMSTYPKDGSIRIVNDTVIVKFR